VHYLDGAWTRIIGWCFVLAGLAAFAAAIVWIERRGRLGRAAAAATSPRLAAGREWDLVMRRATRELARGPKVEALQADAMVSVEAAEYAYNRMLQEYARHSAQPALPTLPAGEPLPQPRQPVVPEPVAPEIVVAETAPTTKPAEERAPLAA